MNKQEEKRFDEEFSLLNGYFASFGGCDLNELKNWITQHDKRERERLIDKVFELFAKCKTADDFEKELEKLK